MPGKEVAKAPVQVERHSTSPPETQVNTSKSSVRGGDDDDDASRLTAGYARKNGAWNKFQRPFVRWEGLFGDDGAAQGGDGGGHSGLSHPFMNEVCTTARQTMETSKSDDDPSIRTGKKRKGPDDAYNQRNRGLEIDIISSSTNNNNSNAMPPMGAGMTNIQDMMKDPNIRELMMMHIRMGDAGMGGGHGIPFQMNGTRNTPIASNQPTSVHANAGGGNNDDTANNSSLEKRNYGMGNPMDSAQNAFVAWKRNYEMGNQMESSRNAFVAPSGRALVHADRISSNDVTDENSSLGKRNCSMCAEDAEGDDV